jgi:alkylhydroperoxidase/carboxymuconolactone decarboxylase family protein YurZ
MAKSNEWLVSADWSDFDQNYSAIVSYPDFSNDQIIAAMKRAYKEWYFRPSSVWKLARGVRSWNDVRVLWATGTAHLKWIRSKGPLFNLGAKNREAIEGAGAAGQPKRELPVVQ